MSKEEGDEAGLATIEAEGGKLEAIVNKQSDVPGYAPSDTLYPYGFGMTY